MLELGDKSADYHKEVGGYMAEKKIDELILFGTMAANIGDGFNGSYKLFKKREEINEYLLKNLKSGDAVLFKGSRGMKLNECVDFLKENYNG